MAITGSTSVSTDGESLSDALEAEDMRRAEESYLALQHLEDARADVADSISASTGLEAYGEAEQRRREEQATVGTNQGRLATPHMPTDTSYTRMPG